MKEKKKKLNCAYRLTIVAAALSGEYGNFTVEWEDDRGSLEQAKWWVMDLAHRYCDHRLANFRGDKTD